MFQLLLTDFIRSRTVQCITLSGFIFDIATTNSISHVLILFGIPYLTSIGLGYLMNAKKVTVKARISEQYRPVHLKKRKN